MASIQGAIYPQHELLRFYQKLKEKGFSVNDFNIKQENDNPIVFSSKKVKAGTTGKFFSWKKISTIWSQVDYCPAENYLREVIAIEKNFQEPEQEAYKRIFEKVIEYFDHFLIKLSELLRMEDEADQLVNEDFNEFINSDYWESDEPIEKERRSRFIEQLTQTIGKINALPDAEVPPVVKNYYTAILEKTIEAIRNGASRRIVKENLYAFGYAVLWDCILHPESKFIIWEFIKALGKASLIPLGINIGR